ncbi:trichothecene c-15 hydroxylase [Apiospora marii]|uniref:Trichothecene c-15 hydroxylase n=1 Tax=Apiospora marii TaxID=335849 RepID=A0ABR1R607_9PEZI
MVVYLVGLVLYNLFLHPLRKFPGPKLWAATRIPYTRNQLSGVSPQHMLDLHLQYGPIVRVAPEILSINHPDGMKQVRGHRRAGQPEHGKDPLHVAANATNIIGADRDNHARFRRILAHVFSAQAMAEQEPLIKVYIDKLFASLKRECAGETKVVDLLKWYNWTTFDIIGDLSFGEPFGSLDSNAYHPWVSNIFGSIKSMAFGVNANRYPFASSLLQRLVPAEIKTKWAEHQDLSLRSLRKRLDAETDRPDFVDKMLHARGTKGGEMTFEEMASHSALLIIAGSETTATLLSGATYLLATHPAVLAKLTTEVRAAFPSEDAISIAGTSSLPYLLAVLDESLRIYPPPRKIAKGGDTIVEHFVPEDTVVEIWQWAVYNNPTIITEPENFAPERWLGDPKYKNDRLDAVQPFSVGPRNCIGKNLAYAEMRMILARIIWNFDLSIAPQSRNWIKDNLVYFLWEKPPLEVALTPRQF